jgi:hypothetical protein
MLIRGYSTIGLDIALYGMTWSDGGTADISIDGQRVGSTNFAGTNETCNVLMFTQSGFNGFMEHTLTVTSTSMGWIYIQDFRWDRCYF